MTKLTSLFAVAVLAVGMKGAGAAEPAFRPPAVPLVASDPYESIWSEADHLNDDVTRHWTHHAHSLISLIRIDGKTYRLMGKSPEAAPPFPQTGVSVQPTRSIYDFDDGPVHVTLTFLTPLIPHDRDVLTRPVTYITWKVSSKDGAPHSVSIFDSASSELAVHSTDQKVQWARETMGGLTALKVGTQDQPILGRMGDNTRIDWGFAYLAADTSQTKSAIGDQDTLVDAFAQ